MNVLALGLAPGDWIQLARTVLLVAGGLWAFYVYRTTRRSEAKLGIEPAVRLHLSTGPRESLLLVRLRMRNTSGVLFRLESARATLLDASGRRDDGSIMLLPIAQQDPVLPVYGEFVADDAQAMAGGAPFAYWEGQRISLEPGEFVDAEMAFPLSSVRLALMAMRVTLRGFQGRWGRRPYEWGTFFYVDPAFVETARVPATLARGERG